MDDSNSTEYYRTREHHARGLAQPALDPAVAKIHLEMADRYAGLVRGTAPVPVIVRQESASA